jgi:hypothetical protein
VIVPGRRRCRIVGAAAVALWLLALSGGEARAAPLTVRLDYTAGPGCPDGSDFKAVVIARLGYDPFLESAPEHVLVRIAPRDHAIDGSIEWRDASGQWAGEQTFPSVSTDCPHLARAMGFALAVQIQLLAKANAAAPNANGGAPAETAAAPAPDASKPAPDSKRPVAVEPPLKEAIVASAGNLGPAPAGAPGPVFAMGAGASVGLGMSSSPLPLARLFGALEWQHVSVELAAIVSLPATTRRPDGAGVSQQLLLGGAAACATAMQGSACLVANAGEVRMAGENIDRPTTASVPLVQIGARLAIRQALGRRVFVTPRADGLVNLIRWTGSLDRVPVWTAPRYSAAIGLDAGIRFQ